VRRVEKLSAAGNGKGSFSAGAPMTLKLGGKSIVCRNGEAESTISCMQHALVTTQPCQPCQDVRAHQWLLHRVTPHQLCR